VCRTEPNSTELQSPAVFHRASLTSRLGSPLPSPRLDDLAVTSR